MRKISYPFLLLSGLLVLFSFSADSSKRIVKKSNHVIVIRANGLDWSQLAMLRELNGMESNFDRFTHIGQLQSPRTTTRSEIQSEIIRGKKLLENPEQNLSFFQNAAVAGYNRSLLSDGKLAGKELEPIYSAETAPSDYDRAEKLASAGIDLLIGGGRLDLERPEDKMKNLNAFRLQGYKVDYKLKSKPKSIKESRLALFCANGVVVKQKKDKEDFLEKALSVMSSRMPMLATGKYCTFIEFQILSSILERQDSRRLKEELLLLNERIGRILDLVRIDNNCTVIFYSGNGLNQTQLKLKEGQSLDRAAIDWRSNQGLGNMSPVLVKGVMASEFAGIYDEQELNRKINNLFK